MKIDCPKYVLALDCETTGLVSGKTSVNPAFDHKTGEHYQAIAWGIVVVDFATLTPVEWISRTIQYDGSKFGWSPSAERIHGLSQQYLLDNGIPEQEFVVELSEMIVKYWGISTPVICLGYNVWFDIVFLRETLDRHSVPIHFSNRVIDTNSLGMVLEQITGSDQLFEHFGIPPRQCHDPLQDALSALVVAEATRKKYTRM